MPVDWPKDRFDLRNSGHPPTTGPTGSPNLKWECDLGYGVPGTPAVVGDHVYAATMYPTNSQSSVFGVNRETGEITMQTPPDDPSDEPRGSVCVDAGIVYVSILDGIEPITRGYDAVTGERVREYDVQPRFHTDKSPFVADGVVYSPVDFALAAFDADSESGIWSHAPDGELSGTPALADGTLYAGVIKQAGSPVSSGDEDYPLAQKLSPRLRAIDAKTGCLEWERNILPRPQASAVVDGTCYVAGQEPYRRYMTFDPPDELKDALRDARSDGGVLEYGIVQAVDTDDGAERWRCELPEQVTTPPAVTTERVVVGTAAGTILGIDALTGELSWRFSPDTTERVWSAPATADGIVYVGCGEVLYGLDVQSGAERWQYNTGALVDSSPAVVDGTVYVAGADDMLRAIH